MIKSRFFLVWYLSTLSLFIFSLIFLTYLSFPRTISTYSNNYQKYKALPAASKNLYEQQVVITKADAKSIIVQNFLKTHQPKLSEYTSSMMEATAKYQLDYKLIPAIAVYESKQKPSVLKKNNPFALIGENKRLQEFSSIEECIEAFGEYVYTNYYSHDIKDPSQIMEKYHPSKYNNSPSMAVVSLMEQIK